MKQKDGSMRYILDTHVHTKEVSPCSNVNAKDMVDLYVCKGYDGVMITDHYFFGFFENLPDRMPWEQKVHSYLKGYLTAKEYASGKNLDIFLAIELTFTESSRDYIIYGITEDFLAENPELYKFKIRQFRDIADKNGLFIVQAHPFRPYIDPPEPGYLDAVEVFNGNKRHDSNNDLALKFAHKYGLPGTSGSDFHRTEDAAAGGMILPGRIKDLSEFVYLLKNDEKELKIIS
jgi:predicted metal-dependent phosphoesterase TrpH